MSYLLRQEAPVKVFRSTDIGAPVITDAHTPNRIINLLKACLVDGYGATSSAGWSAESNPEGTIHNLTPPQSPDVNFTVNLTLDDGRQLSPIMYKNMTSLTEGEYILQCDTEFKYATGTTTGEWVVIATDIGFWFFCETAAQNGIPTSKSGAYFYCGATTKGTNSVSGLYMAHSGGGWGISDDDRSGLFSNNSSASALPAFNNPNNKITATAIPTSMFTGGSNSSIMTMASTIYVLNAGEIWRLPAIVPSRIDSNNYDIITSGNRQYICHGTSQYQDACLLYIPIDYWEY